MNALLDDASSARPAGPRRLLLHRWPRLALLAAVGCAVLLTTATGAWAHARLVRSTPASGAVLATSPKVVELKFNEILDNEFNDVGVFPAKKDGSPASDHSLTTGKPHVDPKDRTRLTTDLGPLEPGAYVVQWKVLSRDGHSALGRVPFRVGKPG
jgi:methionine-rich copper-binding protein CopC